MRPRQEFPPATSAREALQRALSLCEATPRLHLDEALVKATGLPADGRGWNDQKTQVYCEALEILRLHLPIWSVTGYSNTTSDEDRLELLRRVAS